MAAGWRISISYNMERVTSNEATVTLTYDYEDGYLNYSTSKNDPSWTNAKLDAFAAQAKAEKVTFDSNVRTRIINATNRLTTALV